MDFDITREIREIVHGLGERKQRKDTMHLIQSVVFNQMAMLISQTHTINENEITIKNVIYVLRNHKHTLIRMMRYYLFKENIHKLTTVTNTEDPDEKYIVEQSTINEAKKIKVSNDHCEDIAHKPSSFDETTNLDPISALTNNYVSTNGCINKYGKKKGLFNSINNVIKELNLGINIVTDIHISNVSTNIDARQIRINELANLLTPKAYECFEMCRQKNFQNKTGGLILKKVLQALPISVTITSQIRDIFLYLAKETVACLIDRVYENRKKCIATNPESICIPEKNESSEIQKREPLIVNEIIAVTTTTWNRSLNDIYIPFDVNDAFLKSQLIFD